MKLGIGGGGGMAVLAGYLTWGKNLPRAVNPELDPTYRPRCEEKEVRRGLKEMPLGATGPEEIFVGVSCCARPEGLGAVWNAHRRAILAALSTGLQGLRGEIRDSEDLLLKGSKFTITVNSTVESFETDR